jgi:uncharacterized protein YcbK (DUF882 family)
MRQKQHLTDVRTGSLKQGRELAIMADNRGERFFSRRRILSLGAATAAGLASVPAAARGPGQWMQYNFSWGRPKLIPERALSFRHLHTDERLDIVYYSNGRYIPAALEEVNYLLRDFRSEDVTEIDPRLLDTLYSVKLRVETNEPFDILSGYRSPATNAMLRRSGIGVARNSLHMRGMAVDIRLADRDTRNIARAAMSMEQGGVGFYPRSNFVHLDTGSFRTWIG